MARAREINLAQNLSLSIEVRNIGFMEILCIPAS